MFTLGNEPYIGLMEKSEIAEFLNEGKRLDKPDFCNDDIYAIMMDCWLFDRDQRPNFTDLETRINNSLQA